MHPRTRATLDQLEPVEWFRAVGQIVDEPRVITLSSWAEAIAHCSSVEWENFQLEAANRFREALLERARERYQSWNEIVEQMKTVIVPLVDRKIAHVVREHNLPEAFANDVRWDILHLCMECEYGDFVQPGFYAGVAFWYRDGHFPCGWEGQPPEGKLIVY